MKVFSVVFFTVLLIAVTAGGKLKKLKKEVKSLTGAIAKITARMNTLEAERVELDQTHAWQTLHMAAAAACAGSAAHSGSGPNGNAVLAKENTKSCVQVCNANHFNRCEADVSISGYIGQAQSYSQRLGHFYRFRCETPGDTDVKFDEVKAEGGDVFKNMDTGHLYYRFCCCR